MIGSPIVPRPEAIAQCSRTKSAVEAQFISLFCLSQLVYKLLEACFIVARLLGGRANDSKCRRHFALVVSFHLATFTPTVGG